MLFHVVTDNDISDNIKGFSLTVLKKHLLRNLKQNAKLRGIPFELTIDDIDLPTHCPIFGFELTINSGKGPKPNSFSFDRLDNTKGYVPGNVKIVSQKANWCKSDMTIDQCQKLLDYMKSR